jgi:hypothetical protein
MLNDLIQKLKTWNKKRRVAKHAKRLGLEEYEDVEELFSDFYRNNTWSGGKGETVSGSGSTLEKTEKLRLGLPAMFEKYGIRRIFDAPCGDYNWFRHIERNGIHYTGGDIVRELVESNRENHTDELTDFIHFDILTGKPPEADVWFCRDTLLHFSFENIELFFRNYLNSGIPYLLVSTYHECSNNIDIPTGAGRELNLEIAPINLPPALDYVDDWNPGDRPKKMGLWSREAIHKVMQ